MRMRNQLLTMVAAIAILMSTQAPSGAEDDAKRLHHAWEDALLDMEGVLTPEQTGVLHHLAHQAAVARVCDGFTLNHQAFSDAVNVVVKTNSESLDTAQFITRHTDIVMKLGTAYGLFLAEGNLHKDSFCGAATEDRKDTALPSVWE